MKFQEDKEGRKTYMALKMRYDRSLDLPPVHFLEIDIGEPSVRLDVVGVTS